MFDRVQKYWPGIFAWEVSDYFWTLQKWDDKLKVSRVISVFSTKEEADLKLKLCLEENPELEREFTVEKCAYVKNVPAKYKWYVKYSCLGKDQKVGPYASEAEAKSHEADINSYMETSNVRIERVIDVSE